MKGAVLVTGGAGYIASHTCKALAQAGYIPIAYDSLTTGHRHNVKWGPLVVGDLSDGAKLLATVRRFRPEAVLHFAGSAYVGESVQDPHKYFRNNTFNSLILLEILKTENVDSIVFSSSCSTYGVPRSPLIAATHSQQPINPYGYSKLMVERMIIEFGRAYGLRYSILRYFNAAGADPDGELAEEHFPETHLIPLVVDAASGRGPSVEVFGNDYPTPDGTCIRDYIHVTDLAAAHVLALQRLESGVRTDIRNLGVGRGVSVKQVIHAVESVSGRRVPVVDRPRRPGDPPALTAEPDGQPMQFPDIEQIVETVVRSREKAPLVRWSAPA